ncbi:helix-turn-helix transcriptional regulator [Nesterenkonia marinintestina]|uniref:helix-turn-helix transcriptional regulator n=1 Tax=Nesterenkonia marinintestina TaxID=2979865 RepID=UPI0021BE1C54|nr:helix-turn-helix domain-containing protein [Nesterenkonia sp. GX14115]
MSTPPTQAPAGQMFPTKGPNGAEGYLGVAEGTLRRWRHEGIGPRSVKLHGLVRYPRAELDRWLQEQIDQQWSTPA